jgi:phosphatidylglycerol lysyltransferase
MRALAVLLVPWTLLLASPWSRGWFPSEGIRWAWIAFDVVVCVALYRLSERWNPRVAAALTFAIALDAALTLLQAILFDLPRHRAPLEVVIILAAVLAPATAASLLWLGRVHRDRVSA